MTDSQAVQPASRPTDPEARLQLAAGLAYRLTVVLVPAAALPAQAATGHADPAAPDAMLMQWAATATVPVHIVHLTGDHRTPHRFLDHLAAILTQTQAPRRSPDARTPAGSPETRAIELLNDLLALAKDVALVLVNVDAAASPAVCELLGFLAEYLPPRVHLYLVGRTSPALPNLARLRVRRRLLEIDWRRPAT